MIRHQKEKVQIIVQKSRVDETDYRVLIYRRGSLEVVNFVDTSDTGGDYVRFAGRRKLTKRVRHIFHAMVDQRGYCNMTKRYLCHMGFNPQKYEPLILTLCTEEDVFDKFAFDEWIRYIKFH